MHVERDFVRVDIEGNGWHSSKSEAISKVAAGIEAWIRAHFLFLLLSFLVTRKAGS